MGVFLDILRMFFGGSSNRDPVDVVERVVAKADVRHVSRIPIGDVLPADVVEGLKSAMPSAAFAQFERGVPPAFLARLENGLPEEMMAGLAGVMSAEMIERLNQSLKEHARMKASGGTATPPAESPTFAANDGIPGATMPEATSWDSGATIPQAKPWVPDAKISGDDPWHPGQKTGEDPWHPGQNRKSNDPWHPG